MYIKNVREGIPQEKELKRSKLFRKWSNTEALTTWEVNLCVSHTPEPVFLNVYGAQELTPRNVAYVAWRAGTITLFLLGS
jgi:hypothetical protein